jgi:hypothetical protein
MSNRKSEGAHARENTRKGNFTVRDSAAHEVIKVEDVDDAFLGSESERSVRNCAFPVASSQVAP